MKVPMDRWGVVILLGACAAFAARAEILMYDGIPSTYVEASSNYTGFTESCKSAIWYAMPPQTGTYLTLDGTTTTLQNPTCFKESSAIPPISSSDIYNRTLLCSTPLNSGGYGAKVLTLADNHQKRTGTLHFRFLLKADAAVLDKMPADSKTAPDVASSSQVNESCGIVWSVDDYAQAAFDKPAMRYTLGYGIGKIHNVALDGSGPAPIQFARGFMVGLHKNAASETEIRLYAWSSDATNYFANARSIPLATGITGGKTYVCYVQIEIGYFPNGDERLCGMAQPTDAYDKTASWAGDPFPLTLRANLVGGAGAETLKAHLTVQGRNLGADGGGYVRFDEFGLATERTDLVVYNPPQEKFATVLAFDSFPSGSSGNVYSESSQYLGGNLKNVGSGFSAPWSMYISKSSIGYLGNGSGLQFPACYAAQGIVPLGDTSFGNLARAAQAMYTFRPFNVGTLALTAGETVAFRFLLFVTRNFAINALERGPDTQGTLMPGTTGVQGLVNYVGAGIADCSTQVETGNSMAPCLCRRGNACFFTLTKGSDGTLGMYLNLLTDAEDAQTSYKIMDVTLEDLAEAGTTFLCYAQIEIGTGTNGRERIRAFATDVSKVTDAHVQRWVPATRLADPIEFELIDAAADRYPRHAMAGGSIYANGGFRFDEFALACGEEQYPLVYARYPRGLSIFLLKK